MEKKYLMSDQSEDWVFEGVKKLLRPLARFVLRRSLKFQDLVNIAKEVFVEEAAKELGNQNEKITISRLSVLTGLHRPDVKRIYTDDESTEGLTQNVLARITMQWAQNKKYQTKAGTPRVLSCTGDKNEFRDLVESVSKNYSVRTILDEMLRLELVEESASGLRLIKSVVWVESDKATIDLLARDVESLYRAVEENMERPVIPNLHIRTHYDNIFLSDLPELRSWLMIEGKKFHQKVREKLAKHDKDINIERDPLEPGEGKLSVTVFSNWAGKDGEA